MPLTEPQISFITVTWNCAEELASLLSSLRKQLSTSYEVVVVDNGSEDNVVEVVAADATSRLIVNRENLGFGAGNNRGVAAARAPVSVLINPDTYLLDGSIAQVCALAANADALYGPRVWNVDMSIQPSASPLPGGFATAAAHLLPTVLLPNALRHQLEPWRRVRAAQVGWLTGVCVVARTPLLRRLGPFDPSIHMYSEDLELGIRALASGIPSIFVPDAGNIVHIGDVSAKKRYSDAGRHLSVLNRFRAVRRHRGKRRAYGDLAMFTAGLLARCAAKTILGRGGREEQAWLSAVRSVLTSICHQGASR